MITPYIKILRPQQWIKNLVVILPAFFSRRIVDLDCMVGCLVVFICFSFMASSIYCFNDIIDVENDRRHSKKRYRPIASGEVSISKAYTLMGVMAVSSVAIAYIMGQFLQGESVFQNYVLMGILIAYFVLNIFYTIWLKHFPIIDVCIISLGFVLRLVSGGPVIGLQLSNWIVMMTFLLALFLALAKRRDDVMIFETTGVVMRRNTVRYNAQFMNQAITIVATVTLVCYIMYTVSTEVIQRIGSEYLYCTSFFVLTGILRYLQLALVDNKSGSPTKIVLRDCFIQLCIAGWVILFAALLYV